MIDNGQGMTTRRTFIQAAASTALPIATGTIGSAAASEGVAFRHDTLQAAILDDAHLAAREFGRQIGMQGVPVHSIHSGDITAAWLQTVRPLWQKRRAPIAGLTTPAALFCLEQFAFAHGLRVMFHAEHVLLADGSVEHQVQRGQGPLSAAALRRARARWPQQLADSLSSPRATRGPRPGPSLAALEPALPAGATLLASWIIA